jgi:signal peptidase I
MKKKYIRKKMIATKKHEEPILFGFIQAIVTLIDLLVMFAIIWNVFIYFIPYGSLINIVDGDSMSPTMKSGQIIFSDTTNFEREDIVVSHFPENVVKEDPNRKNMLIVKRVIGFPGDKVEVTQNGIYINGDLLEEQYISPSIKQFTYQNGMCQKMTLDNDEYFLVGDNREVSYDSRLFGPVKSSDITYKQSETPTLNFWVKILLIIIFLILDMFLYMLIEFILTESIYGFIYNKKNNKKNADYESA